MRCPLVPASYGVLGTCDWCEKELPRLKSGHPNPNRRWCSLACSDAYWENHTWYMARPAAIKRDGGRCVRCGVSPALWTAPFAERVATQLEVNHKVPRNGAGYSNGCWHHLEDLETLCHAHHVEETTRQIRSRKPPPQPAGGLKITRPREAEALPLWPF